MPSNYERIIAAEQARREAAETKVVAYARRELRTMLASLSSPDARVLAFDRACAPAGTKDQGRWRELAEDAGGWFAADGSFIPMDEWRKRCR